MLPKRHRLRLRSDVNRVRRHGRQYKHPLMILLVLPSLMPEEEVSGAAEMNNNSQPSRFAFVASRRIGTAVKRNRVKRLMREALRTNIDNIQPGWDGIFIARQAIVTASYLEVVSAVKVMLARARIA